MSLIFIFLLIQVRLIFLGWRFWNIFLCNLLYWVFVIILFLLQVLFTSILSLSLFIIDALVSKNLNTYYFGVFVWNLSEFIVLTLRKLWFREVDVLLLDCVLFEDQILNVFIDKGIFVIQVSLVFRCNTAVEIQSTLIQVLQRKYLEPNDLL